MSDTYILEYHARYFYRMMTSFRNRLRQKAVRYEHPLNTWDYQTFKYISPEVPLEPLTPIGQIEVGQAWMAETAHFQTTCQVPAEFDQLPLYLYFENDGESLLSVNGVVLCGFNPGRCVGRLTTKATPGESYHLLIESCLRMHQVSNAIRFGLDYPPHLFKKAYLFTDYPALTYILDQIDSLFAIYEQTKNETCRALLDFIRITIKPDENIENILAVLPTVQGALDDYFRPDTSYKHRKIFAVGNSHLDVSYLWPIRESVRKCARTFANAVHLMEEFPDFRYVHSQAVLLEWTKTYYPGLYEKVKQKIAEGKIDVLAGMYVESDTNVPSPESLIRQFQYGKAFCLAEFGHVSDICWLPDTFGYSSVLPQIVKKCGLNYFYTAKITKNEVNTFPYNVFRWEGLDGSAIIALIDTFCEYAGDVNVPQIQKGLDRYKNAKEMSDVMYVYGHGDGGGGATREMIAAIETFNRRPDWPKIEMDTATNYFNELGKKADVLPTWQGEIYFEWHQGVYTSKGELKRLNRLFETTARDTEIFGCLAGSINKDKAVLDACWKKVLFNQFHDILTGTTVEESSDIARMNYQESIQTMEVLGNHYRQTLLPTVQDGRWVAVWNTLSFARDRWVSINRNEPVASVKDQATGTTVPFYQTGETLFFQANALPGMGYRVFVVENGCPMPNNLPPMLVEEAARFVIDTGTVIAEIDKQTGHFRRIYFKEGAREVLEGVGNVFELYSEIYEHYCAWNIERETLAQKPQIPTLVCLNVVENNQYGVVLEGVYKLSKSTIQQRITFHKDSSEIEFDTTIDWQEVCMLLKVGFETSVRAKNATYDVGYGTIERPTHQNTSWEQAQVEVCAHQFVDLCEPSFGVSLLNNCKYGHDIKGKRMRLTLLKAPQHPMKDSDKGMHRVQYVFYPHVGDFRNGKTDKKAKSLNTPVCTGFLQEAIAMPTKSFVPVWGSDGIYIGAMVPMDEGFLLRVYENHGNHGTITVDLSHFNPVEVKECWMTGEDNGSPSIQLTNHQLVVHCSPYEIKTYYCRV